MDMPALGAGLAGIGFRNFYHRHVFLLRYKPQEPFEPIVCPVSIALAVLLPIFRFALAVGRLESWQKDHPVVIR